MNDRRNQQGKRDDQLAFSEGMVDPKTPEEMAIADLASKYVAALPNLDYS